MTKISQLVDLGANLAAGDEFVVRDVSDISTPNKKVTSSGFIDYVIAQGVGAGFTQIAAGAGPLARAQASSSGATGTLVFSTAAATTLIERARIDSSGRLLVGTSTTRSNLFAGNAALPAYHLVEGALDNGKRTSAFVYGAGSNSGPILVLAAHASNSVGGVTAVTNGWEVGTIDFQGADGTNFVPAARIAAFVDGTPGANDMPGRLVFSTTADGSASPTERMRITSDGSVLVGSTTIPISTTRSYFQDTRAFVNGDTFTDQCAAVMANGSASGSNSSGASTCYLARYSTASAITPGALFKGYQDTAITVKINNTGNITNSNNSYGSLSDIKLKENIVDAESQWDDIKSFRVRNYNFKEETKQQTHRQIGLIAQEVELISPGLVDDSLDADDEVTKSINYSVLYMKAVKALQEAMERIEQLETSNTDLLARVIALETA